MTGKFVITDKTYGKSLKPAQLLEGIGRCFPDDSGLRSGVLHSLLVKIGVELRAIRDTVTAIEMRMAGGSVLIIYEADGDRARLGLQLLEEQEADKQMGGVHEGREREDDSNDEPEDDDDEGESSDDEGVIGLPFQVKLIDFAHTRLTPGQGPDVGVVKGLETLITLLDERAAQVLTRSSC